MACVLVPLPERDFDVTEVSVPWRLLTRRGVEVVFATPEGQVAQADPLLLRGVIFGQLGADLEPKAFYRELQSSQHFLRPLRYQDINPGEYDGLLLPGGHAKGMRPYLESELLRDKVLAFWKSERPVAAICHGVLVLARTADPLTGRSILFHKRTTSLPRYLERIAYFATRWKLGDYYRTYPDYVEDEVRGVLAGSGQYQRGPIVLFRKGSEHDDSAAFVVEDGPYLSARWPGDAYKLAKALAERVMGS